MELANIPTILSAIGFLAVAAWVLWLDFGSRVNQVFAMFLALQGAERGISAVAVFPDDLAGRVQAYVFIALPFVALALAALAWRHRVARAPGPVLGSVWLPVGLLVAALGFEAAYVVDHSWYAARGPNGYDIGPLFLFGDLYYLSYAIIAAVFGVAYVREGGGPPVRALYLFSLGFALYPAYIGLFYVSGPLLQPQGQELVYVASYFIQVASLALALVPAFVLAGAAWVRRSRALRADALRYLGTLGLALLAALAVRFRFGGTTEFFLAMNTAAAATLWALVGFTAFVLVRHRFLDLDVRANAALRQTVVGGFLVAAFFVASESVAEFFGSNSPSGVGEEMSTYFGIGAAGLLLFALTPIQRVAGRIAKAALPETRPLTSRPHDERLALFAEVARIAWEDGLMTRKERRMLDQARVRLGLALEESVRVEQAALESALRRGAETTSPRGPAPKAARRPAARSHSRARRA